jgi:hypothetical protein
MLQRTGPEGEIQDHELTHPQKIPAWGRICRRDKLTPDERIHGPKRFTTLIPSQMCVPVGFRLLIRITGRNPGTGYSLAGQMALKRLDFDRARLLFPVIMKSLTKQQVVRAFFRRIGRVRSFLGECFAAMRRVGFRPVHIVDVGANHGTWTRKAIRHFPDTRCTMLEALAWFKKGLLKLNDYEMAFSRWKFIGNRCSEKFCKSRGILQVGRSLKGDSI